MIDKLSFKSPTVVSYLLLETKMWEALAVTQQLNSNLLRLQGTSRGMFDLIAVLAFSDLFLFNVVCFF